MLCSCFLSYSYSVRRGGRYSYSIRSSIAFRPIGPQVAANGFDQRPASPEFEQLSSTSTIALSTASLSTSTTKSDARHENFDSPNGGMKPGFVSARDRRLGAIVGSSPSLGKLERCGPRDSKFGIFESDCFSSENCSVLADAVLYAATAR